VGEPLHGLDAHRQALGGQLPGGVDLAHLESQVAARACLAEEGVAVLALARLDPFRRLARVGDAAADDPALAGTAGAVAAAVGEDQAVALGRREQALVGRGLEAVAAGLDPDGVGHGQSWPGYFTSIPGAGEVRSRFGAGLERKG
jgi:hypothetical protein